jgi:hypothetical protein
LAGGEGVFGRYRSMDIIFMNTAKAGEEAGNNGDDMERRIIKVQSSISPGRVMFRIKLAGQWHHQQQHIRTTREVLVARNCRREVMEYQSLTKNASCRGDEEAVDLNTFVPLRCSTKAMDETAANLNGVIWLHEN